MVAFNFEKRFAAAVERGEKVQTIRKRVTAHRKFPEVGDRIQLYTGMRTKQCRKLIDPDPVVTLVSPIRICRITFVGDMVEPAPQEYLGQLAADDGFDSWNDLEAYLCESPDVVFDGVLIRWRRLDG